MSAPSFKLEALASGGGAPRRTLEPQGTSTAAQPRLAPLPAGVSLILPMFEESAVVDRTLSAVLDSLTQNFADFEVIVVDDGSTDDCADKVQRWVEKDWRVVLIRMERNERFGGALRRGLAAATKDWIFYTDFDLPVDLACFPDIWKELQDTDVVTGYSPELQKNLTWSARLLSVGYNRLVYAAFGLPLRDVNFGFKAMRKPVRDRLRLISRSPFVDAELFIQALRDGYTIREVPVPFVRRQAGVSRIRRLNVVLWSLFDLARTRLRPNGGRSGRLEPQPASKETSVAR